MTQPRADPEIFQRGYEETKKGGVEVNILGKKFLFIHVIEICVNIIIK